MSETSRVEILEQSLLSDGWSKLRRYRIRYRRADGRAEEMTREVFERGDGAALLLYSRARRAVLLTRQFRLPAFVNGCADGMLVEAPAGMLDADEPAAAMRREAEEETGYRVRDLAPLFVAYASPGAASERLHFFAAEYDEKDRVGAGGGHAEEGEDIEILETPFDEALAMIGRGEIVDAKTILLLYWAKATGAMDGA